MAKITYGKQEPTDADVIVVPIIKGFDETSLPESWRSPLAALYAAGESLEKPGDLACVIAASEAKTQRIIFVGMGDPAKLEAEKAKNLGAKSFHKLTKIAGKSVAIWPAGLSDDLTFKFIEGLLLRNYLDARWKTGESAKEASDRIVPEFLLSDTTSETLRGMLTRFESILSGTFLARELVATSPVELTPEKLADQAVAIAAKFPNLKSEILDKAAIEKAGMGLLLAVNRGSLHEARFIILTLNPDTAGQPIAIIGKGITFDSGGYNIKPTGHMETMHTDMAGAAAVLGTMQALAELGETKKVVGIIPSTENLISDDAYKPSDIITSLAGKTVEIGNTDAEGRLVLADAVTYAKQTFDPKMIFDLATLTGACIAALGERYAGIFSNEEGLIDKLKAASVDSGEKVWHLPLDDTFMDKMKSKIADLSNTAQGSPGAGASTGAAFIGHFAEKTPWAHIDIAGPSHQLKDPEAWTPPSGTTGFGVNLMTTLIQKYLD